MGPLALFTLVTVLCLAVLAVLAVSTANATLTLSQRRASATTQLYLDETAAQTFTAVLDEQLSMGAASADAVAAATTAAQDTLPADAPKKLQITTDQPDDATFDASFDCGNGRQLDIRLRKEQDGTLSVQKWRFTAVVNEEPAMGTLFGSL